MNAPLKVAWVAAAVLLDGCAGMPGSDCDKAPFAGKREIVETASAGDSLDPCWWLSSGGLFFVEEGVGRTIMGALPPGAEWREKYARNSARDTDNGEHPQNLLRLVSHDRWQDYRQEVRFRIRTVNLTNSPERGAWSGVLMFQRYQDQDNLYYTGLRVDGTAIIKKKRAGKYATLAQRPVFGAPGWYDRMTNPSLLPVDRWVRMASVVRTQADGSVLIQLFARDDAVEQWQILLEAVDAGADGEPIREAGHTGLRGDFMDVEFANHSVKKLERSERAPESGAP